MSGKTVPKRMATCRFVNSCSANGFFHLRKLMNLPNADQAQVDRKKITEYLLCTSHPDGSNKAIFFSQFGFTLENWKILAESLRKHGATYNVTKVVESEYGTRYSVDGLLEPPDNRNPYVRTVWIIEKQSTTPRLITAHPK